MNFLKQLWDFAGHVSRIGTLLTIGAILLGILLTVLSEISALPTPISILIGLAAILFTLWSLDAARTKWGSKGLQVGWIALMLVLAFLIWKTKYPSVNLAKPVADPVASQVIDTQTQKLVATTAEMAGPRIENRVVELTKIPRDGIFIADKDFDNCDVRGPAMVTFRALNTFIDCTFFGPDEDPAGVFYEIDDRPRIVGVIGIRNCRFRKCTFNQIGVVGQKVNLDQIRSQIQNKDVPEGRASNQ